MELQLDEKFYARPTVYIETMAKPSQFPKSCMGVATYTSRKGDGHHKGYLYGFARTDDTFRALILDKIIQDLGLPLNVYCRGLHNSISQVVRSKTGLSAKGKPYQNYEVLKRLGDAVTAGDLHVFQNTSELRDMCKEQHQAYQRARDLFKECEKQVTQFDGELDLDDGHKILKSSFA